MTLDLDTLKQIVREAVTTHEDEIDCHECFLQLDQFIDMKLAGKNAEEAMPLVHDHLDHCTDCHQEFEALLDALNALDSEH